MSEKTSKTVGVRLSAPVHDALVAQCDKENVGMSQVVQRALVCHLGLKAEHNPSPRKRRVDQKKPTPTQT